jgi:predicted ATPase
MPELPTGTVTFLFSDIEGSTKLLEEHGERYAELLETHRRVLREAFERHGGVEVDTQGDAFFVAFPRGGDALAAAEEAQRALEIPVRMGIHTGEPALTDGGYVGIDVHRGARIAATAHGGQVVVSEQTASSLDGEFSLRDLGLHRLKDLGEPVKLFQLGEERFPPLRSLNATNLPAQPPLVGREVELAELTDVIAAGRVVTLTGPGGSGKTRLALQVAAESIDVFVDGVFWVPLAAMTDPELIEPTIGETIGARDGLAEHVDEKRMLLLLDNLEQLLPAAAQPLASLVERCPNLRLLLTSRAPLRIRGEREYAVEPLPEEDAISLFRERAFVAEPEQAVAEICRRLDGLPLAIELAAVRTRVLPPDRLLARLDQALPVLTGGHRDAPERQRTLRATIEWSYDLLDEEEQRLFARLAVFAGSFKAEAAETICDAELDTLEALVEHSLVRRWASGRLGMLETIRELAVEKLEESGEGDEVRRRHAEFFHALGESAGLRLDTLGKLPQRHDLVLPDLHNFRAAMDWTAEADPELGLRIAVAIENIWVTHDPREGIRRFETLFKRATDVDPYLRARALLDLGGCAEWSGDEQKGRAVYEEALDLFRQLGDESGVAEARFRLGVVASRRGDFELARELWQESLEEWQRLGHEAGVTQALGNLGWWEFVHGDDWQRAWELTERSLELARRIGWTWHEVGRLGELAERSLEVGDVDEGERRARDYLARAHEIEDRTNTLYGLGMLAWVAGERGDAERAVTLWAAIEAEEARRPEPMWALAREQYAARIPDAPRPAVPLELEQAIDYALADA